MGLIGEAGGKADLAQRSITLEHHCLGPPDPAEDDVVPRRPSEGGVEGPGEMPGAKPDCGRELRCADGLRDAVLDEVADLAHLPRGEPTARGLRTRRRG